VEVREIKLSDGTSAFLIALHAERRLGSEWLNQHNLVTLEILGCNNDVRIVLFSGSVAVVYYTAAYVAKVQSTSQKVSERTLVVALKARREKEDTQNLNIGLSDSEIVSRRLHSLLWSVGNAIEIPLTLLVYYMLYKDARESSHTYTDLSIPQLLAFLKGQPTSGSLVRDGTRYVVCSRIIDWVHRDAKTPESWNFWQFVNLTTREKKNNSETEEQLRQSERASTSKRVVYQFQNSHPLSATHVLVFHPENEQRSVVRPTGGHLHSPKSDDEKENFALTALALFASGWRMKDDLLAGHNTTWAAYETALETGIISSDARRIIQHMLDYDTCKAEGRMEAAARAAQGGAGAAHADEELDHEANNEGATYVIRTNICVCFCDRRRGRKM